MEEKILTALMEINKRLDKMDEKIQRMEEKSEKKFDEIQQEIIQIHNQQLLFEHEYGTKIDAIFDAVTLELDKNLEKSHKLHNLEKRMDRSEVTIFNHEKRISSLELHHS